LGRRAHRFARRPDGGGAVLTLLLLDTNVLIDAERSAFDLDALIADDDEPAVAAITIAELGVGVEMVTGKRRQVRRAFLDDVVDTLPIISYDLDVALVHAQLLVAVRRAGRPCGAHDLIIAATALATGRVVVTSDELGFERLPGVVVRRPS
jgi:tRNA(fMet)-specific endonuclease VapC